MCVTWVLMSKNAKKRTPARFCNQKHSVFSLMFLSYPVFFFLLESGY